MYCLKCGSETPAQQLFCEDCLLSMEKYPVKPDTPIQLPGERRAPIKKAPRQSRELPPEVLVSKLRKTIRWLALLCALLGIALLCVLAFLAMRYLGR